MTETPEVAQALDPLRERIGEVRLGELIVLGAQEKLRRLELEDLETVRARRRIAERVLRRQSGGDVELADQVRREGWTRA